MTDDLSDLLSELRELKRKVERLESATPLENASVTDGRLRFIGGTLRVDSGGRVEIVGTLAVEGTSQFIGPVTISGTWTFSGNGAITGNVDLDGALTVKNGQIVVDGPVPIRIRQVDGSARIQFGSIGEIVSRNGSVLFSSSNANIAVGPGNVLLNASGYEISADEDGLRLSGIPDLPAGTTARYLVIGGDGLLYKSAGTGGGGGEGTPGPVVGDYMWPFPPSTTDPVLGMYGMRLNPVTHVWAMHLGRDFSVAGGSAIPAIGDGVVADVSGGDARGYRIRIAHTGDGDLASEYFHMMAPSILPIGAPVTRGQTIGYVGTTGNSTGNHLHLQIWQGGGWVDPTLFFNAQS